MYGTASVAVVGRFKTHVPTHYFHPTDIPPIFKLDFDTTQQLPIKSIAAPRLRHRSTQYTQTSPAAHTKRPKLDTRNRQPNRHTPTRPPPRKSSNPPKQHHPQPSILQKRKDPILHRFAQTQLHRPPILLQSQRKVHNRTGFLDPTNIILGIIIKRSAHATNVLEFFNPDPVAFTAERESRFCSFRCSWERGSWVLVMGGLYEAFTTRFWMTKARYTARFTKWAMQKV
jgi:hypothetical protein